MATTYLAFTPSPTASPPFAAQVTLDGTNYSLITMWNFYAGRWYYSLSNQNGVLINEPLIGSPIGFNIYLAWGILKTSTLVFRVASQNFEIT